MLEYTFSRVLHMEHEERIRHYQAVQQVRRAKRAQQKSGVKKLGGFVTVRLRRAFAS